MSEISTAHHTVVVRRTLNATCARVFAAWRDPSALARWYVPGDAAWTARVLEHEFRVGGRKRLSFGPRGDVPYEEDCRYEDIVENARICFAMTIQRGTVRLTTSMVTVQLLARAHATDMIVTDQLVILDGGDTAADRERGWGETLDKLPAELERRAQ
jgi:uncharacterized protein YndB with AHSA1/START domain